MNGTNTKIAKIILAFEKVYASWDDEIPFFFLYFSSIHGIKYNYTLFPDIAFFSIYQKHCFYMYLVNFYHFIARPIWGWLESKHEWFLCHLLNFRRMGYNQEGVSTTAVVMSLIQTCGQKSQCHWESISCTDGHSKSCVVWLSATSLSLIGSWSPQMSSGAILWIQFCRFPG